MVNQTQYPESVACKHCQSTKTRKYGFVADVNLRQMTDYSE
jgi:hypothetical protein